jgi:DNA polymerase I-like protein with 3'-5' exonuclease and polymerase domains
MQVYDEIVVEAKEQYADLVMQVMRNKMLTSYKMSVPLEVSIGSGKNYQMCK